MLHVPDGDVEIYDGWILSILPVVLKGMNTACDCVYIVLCSEIITGGEQSKDEQTAKRRTEREGKDSRREVAVHQIIEQSVILNLDAHIGPGKGQGNVESTRNSSYAHRRSCGKATDGCNVCSLQRKRRFRNPCDSGGRMEDESHMVGNAGLLQRGLQLQGHREGLDTKSHLSNARLL